MFEAGGESQDQYNINKPSSASNDVIISTSNNQTSCSIGTVTSTSNSLVNNTHLQEKIEHLEKENRNLQGRIRGYTTLGSLLQEEKEANRKLSKDLEELKKKFTNLNTSVNIPQDTDQTQVVSLRIVSPHISMRGQNSLTMSSQIDDTNPIEYDKTDHNEPDQITDPLPRSISREVIPLQESMNDQQNDLSELAANPSMTVSEPPQSHNQNIEENIQIDSDRFEDREYEKIGHPSSNFAQMGLSSTPSMNSSTSQKYRFPSLTSVASQPNRNRQLRENTDFNLMMSCSEPPPSLGHQVGAVAALLGPDNTSAVGRKLRQIADDVDKQEHDLVKHKKLNGTLCEENRRLKTAKQLELHEEKSKNYQLRVLNQNLEARIRELESQQGRVADSLTEKGWVDVEKTLGSKADMELFQNAAAPTDMNDLTQMIQTLKDKNIQLKNANDSWRSRWHQLETSNESKIKSLEKQLADKDLELKKVYKSDNEKQREFEQMLCAAKAHAGDEENAKEEALQQLHLANVAQTELKEKIASLECDNAELVRVKHAIEAEVSVLKKQCYKPQASSQSGETVDSLKTENAVLRQQLTVFAEDFERERQDRAAALSARDELQKKYEAANRLKKQFSERVINLQKKCDHLESELNQARRKSQSLENEKRQIKMELNQYQQNAAMRFQSPVVSPHHFPAPYPQYAQQIYYQPTPMAQPPPMQGFAQSQVPLEHLPGAWTCKDCTFVNIAERTVCEMCGVIRQKPHGPSHHGPIPESNPEVALMSRGHDVPDNDIVTDNDLAMDDGQFK